MSDEFALDDFLPYLLNQAAEAASESFAEIYKSRYGMGRTEWRVLVHLGYFGEMTAGDIGARAREHKTRISRAVSRLETASRIERRENPDDRRQDLLSLTPTGRRVYRDLRAAATTQDAALAQLIGEKDMAQLKSILKRIAG